MSAPQWKVECCYTYGWDDAAWTENDQPMRYATQAEAEADIDEFIRDTADAVARGDMESPYNRADYRAVLVEGGAS